jgi:hypothetical protein
MTKSTFSEGVSKGSEYFCLLELGEAIKVGIRGEFNGCKVTLEPSPSVKLLCIGSFNHGSFSG